MAPVVLERGAELLPRARIIDVRDRSLAGVDRVIVELDESVQQYDDIPDDPRHGSPPPAEGEANYVPSVGDPRRRRASLLHSARRPDDRLTRKGSAMNRTNADDPQPPHAPGRERGQEHAESPARIPGSRADSSSARRR